MRECHVCGALFPKTKKNTMTICKACNTKRVKSQSTVAKMWRRAKNRATRSGMAFDIEKSDIRIPDNCPILKIPLVVHSGSSGGRYNSPSLDKIDPSLGYTKGNIQVISHKANIMKADASLAELRLFAEWVSSL